MKRIGFLFVTLLILPACGGSGGGAGGPEATISISVPGGTVNGAVSVGYALAGSGSWNVVVSFSTDAGATWSGASPASGSATTRSRPAPGAYGFLWDSVADGAAGSVLVRVDIPGSSASAAATVGNAGLTFLDRSATIDAATTALTLPPNHRGQYDLSISRLDYRGDPAFDAAARSVPVKSWRISVGRWEIGPVAIMAPEPACYSTVAADLQTCSREFYRGPNTLAGAQDPSNYHFAYLDGALAAVYASGAEPYLCFDYTPYTLASNVNPNTAANHYLGNPNLSFSNGIRTSPPMDNAVYAEVVKRVVMHVTGTFAGGLGMPLTHVEIGNEPDLPLTYFWTGTRAQFLAMYQACAAALDAQFGGSIRIGAASFAWAGEPDPTFLEDFLTGCSATRLDFVGIHIYQDVPEVSYVERLAKAKGLRDALKPAAELHVPEWGMTLDGGPEFDDMTAAIHHAKALEYYLLFDVNLAHRALVRDPVATTGSLGLLFAGPTRLKPAAHVFQAFESLYGTPSIAAITAQVPAGKPMILAGTSASQVTILFFHEAPPGIQTGRFAVTVNNLPFASYTATRARLTQATYDAGEGLWTQSTRDGAGVFTETVQFTGDVLVRWTLTKK
jgi:hypothetical protein